MRSLRAGQAEHQHLQHRLRRHLRRRDHSHKTMPLQLLAKELITTIGTTTSPLSVQPGRVALLRKRWRMHQLLHVGHRLRRHHRDPPWTPATTIGTTRSRLVDLHRQHGSSMLER